MFSFASPPFARRICKPPHKELQLLWGDSHLARIFYPNNPKNLHSKTNKHKTNKKQRQKPQNTGAKAAKTRQPNAYSLAILGLGA